MNTQHNLLSTNEFSVFFQNARFIKQADKLAPYKKARVLELMEELNGLSLEEFKKLHFLMVYKSRLNKITELKIDILEEMLSITEKSTKLSIDHFICIVDKLCNPSISYFDQSFMRYMFSVDLWNTFIFTYHPKEAGSLCIFSEDLAF